MSNEQLSTDENPIDADEMLRRGALNYAEAIISIVSGTPPGPEAPAALNAARRVIHPKNGMPVTAAVALIRIQVAAAQFTLEMANVDMDRAVLDQLEKALAAALERRGATGIVHTHDDEEATRSLSERALDYAYQRISSQESETPIDPAAIKHSMDAFLLAAATFTVHLTIAEGLDTTIPRWIEESIVDTFNREARAN
jgi:hypothetical protein